MFFWFRCEKASEIYVLLICVIYLFKLIDHIYFEVENICIY